MLVTTSLYTSACWTWTYKRRHATGETLNVSEDGGASYIHVCIGKGGDHAECASDAVDILDSVETSKCVRVPQGRGCTNFTPRFCPRSLSRAYSLSLSLSLSVSLSLARARALSLSLLRSVSLARSLSPSLYVSFSLSPYVHPDNPTIPGIAIF